MNFQKIEPAEWVDIHKLMEYGLRTTYLFEIIDERLSRSLLHTEAKRINPECCIRGNLSLNVRVRGREDRVWMTWVLRRYMQLKQNCPSFSKAKILAGLYEHLWRVSKSLNAKKEYSINEVYVMLKSFDLKQLMLVACHTRGSHQGHRLQYAKKHDEFGSNLCPWCSMEKRKKVAKAA